MISGLDWQMMGGESVSGMMIFMPGIHPGRCHWWRRGSSFKAILGRRERPGDSTQQE